MPRQEIVGTAVGTELAADMTSGSTSFTVVDASGWPTGGGGNPFTVTIGKGTASEEKILCASRTGTTIAVTTRGYDGTTAAAHQTGVGVIHSISAVVLNEANAHVNDTTRDDHTQYLNTTRHDVEVRHQFGGALGVPSAAADIGTAAATGSGDDAAREDHVHKIGAGAINSTGMFDAALYGGAPANVGTSPSAGVAATVSRSDHVHDLGNSSINDPTLFATGLRPRFVVADATALAALTPTEGDVVVQLDVDRELIYTGAAWVRSRHYSAAGRTGGDWRRVANQGITHNTLTTISWDTEDFDSDAQLAHHVTTGTTYTVPAGLAGRYNITPSLSAVANNGSTWLLQIVAGGRTYEFANSLNDSAATEISGSVSVRLAAGDTIQVKVKQTTGGTIQHTGSLSVERVSL